MTLLDLAMAIAVFLAMLAVVGGLPAWAIGLRGYWAVAASPAFAVTVIAGAAAVAPWVGMRWSILPVAVLTILLSAAIYAVRRLTPARPAPREARRRVDLWLIGTLVVAAGIMTVRIAQIVQGPGNISQTFDDIFHLNAIRFVLDTGNASSLHIGSMTSPAGTLPFYPAAWHAAVSLVVQLSGVAIPVAVNAAAVVVAAVIWPLGIVLLSRTLFGRHPAFTVTAGSIAVSLPAFPILPMDYGVLYPYQLGLALLPVALAATLVLLRLVPPHSPSGAWWWGLIVLGVIPGMTLAHPGAFVAWLALTAPMAVAFVWMRFRAARTTGGRLIVAAGALAYLVIGAVLVDVLRPPAEARGWPPQMSIRDAALQVFSVSMWYLVPAFVVAVGVVAGVVWAFIDRKRPGFIALGDYVIAALLFVTVAALPFPPLRDALTGSWYNNLPRVASILVIAIVPLASYGWGRTWIAGTRAVRERGWTDRWSVWARVSAAVVVGVLFCVGLQIAVMDRAVAWAGAVYRFDASSPLLSTDEYALLSRVDDHVPEGVAIAGSPFTGASLAYAFADRPVLMPHALMEISPDLAALNEGLDTATAGSAACRAVQDLGVGFVLDFAGREVHPGSHPFPGLDDLADSAGVRLVDSEGDARLYEITACGAVQADG